jgi:hypothetical protein
MEQSTREITPYGDGLFILISAHPTLMDSWLSFACWASIQRQLPDSKVIVACCDRGKYNHEFFRWTHRAKVPHFVYSGSQNIETASSIARSRGLVTGPILVVPSYVMVLDSLGDEIVQVLNTDGFYEAESHTLPAKNTELSRFSSVLSGVGSFVPDKWIDRNGYPFGNVDRFSKGPLTANERRVFQLWKKIGPLYDTIG